MKLGVMIEGQEGIGWEEWRNITRWTEELGYESLWRSDHFFSFFGASRSIDALETMVSLAYTAMNSRRIRFGPLVLSMTFRHPGVLARMAAAIDQLSEGRLILGIGAGWNVPEHEAYGIELPPLKQRMDNLEEGIQVIKSLFEQESASFSGKRYTLKDAPMSPKPSQQPMPLLIGGGGEKRTLRMVARYASEWNMPAQAVERYKEKVRILEEHCEREGRDPKSIDRSLMYSYITGTRQSEIDEKLAAVVERMPPQMRQQQPGQSRPQIPWLVGTPDRIVEQIQELEELGVSRIMLQHRTPPTREELAFVAEEILPRV